MWMKYATLVAINLIAACLIAFGVEGCSGGSDVHGWSVLAGFLLLTTGVLKRDKLNEEE